MCPLVLSNELQYIRLALSRRAACVSEADRWYGAGSRPSRSNASSQFGSSWR